MKRFKKIIKLILIIFAFAAIGIFIYMRQPQFGKLPSGERLERIKKSPFYKNGQFENIENTPQLTEGSSMSKVLFKFIFSRNKRVAPDQPFHFSKTNLFDLDPNANVFIWMGHSSYYIQIDGKKILVDPVFSGSASPIPGNTKAFKGADLYSTEDIPEFDYLIITHDHWDHLDYKTVVKLNSKVKQVITGLGTGEHLEYWNYDPKKIIELDWNESADLGNGFSVHCETARHFSGRTLKRNRAIWASFVVESDKHKIFIGGDSGFGNHFENIGKKYGNLDLAILEMGQYNLDWKYIHLLPEQFLTAAKNLNAKTIIPVHNSKFALAAHDWDEPLKLISAYNEKEKLHLITPKIGQKADWTDENQIYEKWWEDE